MEKLAILERMMELTGTVEDGFADPSKAFVKSGWSRPDAGRAMSLPGRAEALPIAVSPHPSHRASLRDRKVAVLAGDGVRAAEVETLRAALRREGASVRVIAATPGTIASEGNGRLPVDRSLLTEASIFYDAVFVPGGPASVSALRGREDAAEFLRQARRHQKPIGASLEALAWVACCVEAAEPLLGEGRLHAPGDGAIVTSASTGARPFASAFLAAMRLNRA